MTSMMLPVRGWEGKYSVSEDDNIWSHKYKMIRKPNPYGDVQLREGDRTELVSVDLLVLTTFGRKMPPGDLRIIHLDGDATNFALGNLDFDLQRCMRGHAFIPENIYTNPSRPGVKHCKACRLAHQEVHVAKRRDARAQSRGI